jgi:hypothetical protein
MRGSVHKGRSSGSYDGNTKMTAFGGVASCSLIEEDWRFRGAYHLHHQGDHPDDGGSKHL